MARSSYPILRPEEKQMADPDKLKADIERMQAIAKQMEKMGFSEAGLSGTSPGYR